METGRQTTCYHGYSKIVIPFLTMFISGWFRFVYFAFVDDLKNYLTTPELCNRLLEESSDEFGIDISKKQCSNGEIQSSFRQLNIDD